MATIDNRDTITITPESGLADTTSYDDRDGNSIEDPPKLPEQLSSLIEHIQHLNLFLICITVFSLFFQVWPII